MAKDKFYGEGEHVRNPFFPTEEAYEGSKKTLISAHGSTFDYEIDSSNEMDRRLERTGHKLPGKFVDRPDVMGK